MAVAVASIQWQESPTGFVSARYEIVRQGPNDWRLRAGHRRQSEHRTASAAKAAARRLENRRRRNAKLHWVGAQLVIVAVLAGAMGFVRFETNPARAEAESLAVAMEAAWRAVDSGAADVHEFADVVRGAVVPLPNGVDLSVLLGQAGGECYVLYWHPATIRRGRVMTDGWECEPSPRLVSPNEHAYTRWAPRTSWHFPSIQGRFDWEALYPDETRQRGWYFPAMIALAVAAVLLVSRGAGILLGRGAQGASRSPGRKRTRAGPTSRSASSFGP